MRISFLPKRPLKSEAKTFPMVAAVNHKVYVLKELVFYLNSSVMRSRTLKKVNFRVNY